MADLVTRLFRRFGALLIPPLILLTAAFVSTFVLREAERRRISEVETPTPGWLPVVAFTPGGADLLWYAELDEYKRAHPEYSFLAPDGQDEILNQKLAASYRRKVPMADAHPEFKAKPLSDGRQSLEVGLYGDGQLVAWYEATDKEIYPRRYLGTGVFFAVIPFVWSFVISGVMWGFIYGLWRAYREVRQASV